MEESPYSSASMCVICGSSLLCFASFVSLGFTSFFQAGAGARRLLPPARGKDQSLHQAARRGVIRRRVQDLAALEERQAGALGGRVEPSQLKARREVIRLLVDSLLQHILLAGARSHPAEGGADALSLSGTA